MAEYIIKVGEKGFEKPTIIQELVRCKDCTHYNAGYECLIEGYGVERDSEWFCGDGEKDGDNG